MTGMLQFMLLLRKREIPGLIKSFARTLSESMKQHSLACKELKIPIPYGHIAAKAWGNRSGHPVLALHGWQDNCGSFDRLIPLLSPSLYIIAIDAPGHGYSSHKPGKLLYHQMEFIVDIQRIVKFMNWNSFSIIGHSYGGILSYLYASIFPEYVQNLIALDVFKPISRPSDRLQAKTRRGIDEVFELEPKIGNMPPIYTYEDAKKRLIEGTFDEITSEAADTLLNRGIKKSDCGTGFVFTRDIRIRVTNDLYSFSHDVLKGFLSNMICNLLLLTGRNSRITLMEMDEKQEFLDLYKKHCKSFEHVEVEGSHFAHLNNPEVVAPHINDFFDRHIVPYSNL